MGAGAHALMDRKRGRQQGLEDTCRVPDEVRAPNSACTRSSSGVQRTVSNAPTGETVTSAKGVARRQPHTLNRGASTSTVPNRVCSRRVRRSFSGCNTPQAVQARWWAAYSATCPHSMLACSLAGSALLSASIKPISASVPTTPGRLNVASSVVVTSPALVLASSRTVHCITPAVLVVRRQPGQSARDGQVAYPKFLTLPSAVVGAWLPVWRATACTVEKVTGADPRAIRLGLRPDGRGLEAVGC